MNNETQKKMIAGHSDARTITRVYLHADGETISKESLAHTRMMVGHSDVRTIVRTYLHADKEAIRKEMLK